MSKEVLSQRPVHLRPAPSAVVQPELTDLPQWSAAFGARHEDNDLEGRLVAMHTFTKGRSCWEMHPPGAEVVLCTAGEITVLREQADATVTRIGLLAGEYAINPPGVWHTADVDTAATCVFITAGSATEHKARH